MTSRAGVRLVAIVALGGASAVLLAQQNTASSLSVRLAPKTVNVAVVTIENQSDYSLLTWYLELVGEDGRIAQSPKKSKDALALQWIDDAGGSILPHQRRLLRFVAPEGFAPKSVRLTYAGVCCVPVEPGSPNRRASMTTTEGDQAILDEEDRRVAAISASAEYWQTALAQAPTDDPSLRTFVKTRVDESVRLGVGDDGRIRAGLIDALEDCSSDALLRTVRSRQQQRQPILDLPPQPRTVRPVTSALVRLEPSTTADEVVAYVTNNRDVAADVWEVEIYSRPETHTPIKTFTSRGGHDSRLTAASVEHPIGPHDVRELLVMSPSSEENVVPVPRAVLTVAAFDDGRFNGSPERRDQLFAERARDAVDIEYWLQPLRLVRNVSAANAVDALRDRVRTRKCQSSSAFHIDHFAAGVLTVASEIQAAPDRKDAILAAAIARLEDERQAILKLVNH